jgi:hypothetical protein
MRLLKKFRQELYIFGGIRGVDVLKSSIQVCEELSFREGVAGAKKIKQILRIGEQLGLRLAMI